MGVLFGLNILFFGIGMLIPKVDPAFVNLPNKSFWLDPRYPHRVAQTYEYLKISMLSIGINASVFLFLVFEALFETGRTEGDTNMLPLIWVGLALLFIVDAVIIFKLINRFMNPRKEEQQEV